MSEIDWPASVREYEKDVPIHLTLATGHEAMLVVKDVADAAIADLKRLLEANIEWGRIEQKRKQKAEAEVERLKWMLRLAASDYSVLDLVDSEDAYLAYLERRWAERKEDR